ncbi:alpha-(1,3)-fucosyltransferase, partial [Trichinella spiralis]
MPYCLHILYWFMMVICK